MKLERNAKVKEQKAVMQHLIRRKRAGKQSALVRIRGHKIDLQKLSRWMRDTELIDEKRPSLPMKSPSRRFCDLYFVSHVS